MKNLLLIMICGLIGMAAYGQTTTTVWNPAANANSTGLWSEAENWTQGTVPDGDFKVVFNVDVAHLNCILDSKISIKQLVMGDNKAAGDTLVLQDTLNTNADWIAIGYNNVAVLQVDVNGVLNTTGHLWIGLAAGSDGTLIVDGGEVNVSQMTGVGWDGGTGTVLLNSGTMNLANFTPGGSIKDGSVIKIGSGVIKILGDKSAAMKDFIAADKIIGINGTGNIGVRYDPNKDSTFVEQLPGAAGTTVWTGAGGTGNWMDYMNWSDKNTPGLGSKVVFNVPEADEALLQNLNNADNEDTVKIKQLVLGDNAASNTLVIGEGGIIKTSIVWNGVGYNAPAKLRIEDGGSLNFGEHLWVGFLDGSQGSEVTQNGGVVNVSQMFGIGWNGGSGTYAVNGGVLNLANINATDQKSISDGSILDVSNDGVIAIKGNRTFHQDNTGADVADQLAPFIDASKITANVGFSSVIYYYDEAKDTTFIVAPPMLSSSTPADGSADVAVDAGLSITFSKPMDPASVEGAIVIAPELTNTVFAWDGSTVTISSDNYIEGMPYTVSIGTGATDLAGNALEYEEAFTFTVTGTLILGTEDQLSDKVVVYPNPATNEVNFQVSEMDFDKIMIYNHMGQAIKLIENNRISNDLLTWNSGGVKPGIYLYNILSKGRIVKAGKILIAN